MNPGISPRRLPWLKPGDPFPPITQAWEAHDPAPGLLAAGGCLDVPTLLAAYSQGIFPWFSDGEPLLWWSTDPRMVLSVDEFKLHRSLKRELRTLVTDGRLELRFDREFGATIRACATAHRPGQNGTWIVEEMQQAYVGLHLQGHAHGIEAWVDGARCGGLYVVSMGKMVFGESMFSLSSNGSKLALCGLVAFCRHHGIPIIDCQQQTPHLASLGARPWERRVFTQRLTGLTSQPPVNWEFDPVYWNLLFTAPPTARDTPPRFAL